MIEGHYRYLRVGALTGVRWSADRQCAYAKALPFLFQGNYGY
ncbi:hypothetical protein UFRH6_84 [Pseudomonas phage UF_RH6]|nr:hypothetical protein UFRH6_84 [Pseudomonas phage UF_RH6]